ncbi:MAG: hypothetical protein AAFP90_11880, partial [Planctomycetota bacterium]
MGDLSFLLLQRYPQSILRGFVPVAVVFAIINSVLLAPDLMFDWTVGAYDEIYIYNLISFIYRMM